MTITFQDAKRISGLSTDTKPTNVASGSIFLETDAGKRYFSDGSVAVSPDALGSAADGSPYNGVTQNSAGKIGSYAWLFDGVNDYADIPQSIISGNNPFTVSLWIKPTSLKDYAAWLTAGQYAIYKGFYIYTMLNGNVLLGDVAQAVTSGGTVTAGQWNYVVITNDGTNTKIYVNGANVATQAWTWQITAQSPTRLAGALDLQAAYFGNGAEDELSIWSRALSAAEISTLYNSGSGRSIPAAITAGVSNNGLKAYYNFEQTSGSLINQAKTSNWVAEV